MSMPLSSLAIYGSSAVTVTDLEHELDKIELGYSPTAKNKLIQSLQAGRPLEEIDIAPFTPLDLVVYIYALLQTSGIADKRKAILRAFLELSQKFTTMAHYSSVNWQALLSLLRTIPDNAKLIEFLQSEHADEPDRMDFAFFCTTWSELAVIFNSPHELSALELEKLFTSEMSESWLISCEHPEIIVDTLLFTYYLIGGRRFDTWDQKALISDPLYQEFIINVIATCKENERACALLKECNNCYQQSDWVRTLSENAANGLVEIFTKAVDPHIDQSICVHIFDNQFFTISTKIKLVSLVMRSFPKLNLQMLKDFFVLFKKSITDKGADDVRRLYHIILDKKWDLDLIVCTVDTQDLYKEYCRFSGECITNFIELVEEFYDDPTNAIDVFLIKYFMAFVNNLQKLEAEAKGRKSTQIKAVNDALIAIKEAAIRTLFKVYTLFLERSKVRKSIYAYLAQKLVKIDFTGSSEEFMVAQYTSDDGKYTMLGFGFDSVSTQYVIVDQLPEEGV